ncbi:MAG: hypothetical protein CMJ34_14255 [Phycisphaerae bacterium]|nr:hypothetical protein [Phycisphaerae bacterium]
MSSSHASKPDLSDSNVRLGTAGEKIQQAAAIVGICGLLASAVIGFTGMFGTTHDFFVKSWLQNYMFVLSISLGALFFVFIQFLARAGWSATVRRVAELLAGNLQWAWLGLVPLVVLWLSGGSHDAAASHAFDAPDMAQVSYSSEPAATLGAGGGGGDGHGDGHGGGHGHGHAGWGPGIVFPWADMEAMKSHNPAEYDLVSGKVAYLNSTFFWIRNLIYVVFWAFAGRWYLKRSTAQDESGEVGLTSTMQKWSGPMAIGFGLTITFAAFDWIMSLSPGWFSTMFGVYFFCGCCTTGFSMIILATQRLQSFGRLQGLVNAEHYQDLGKLLFAFGMIFWAYIGFSQYMLIWYANIPEETGWFLARQIGGWGTISFLLLFGHFVIPFVAIISKWVKRMRWALMVAAIWMLAFAWLDLFWLVMPVIPMDIMTAETYMEVVEAHVNDTTGITNPLNFTMLAGVGGLYIWMTMRRFRNHRLLAIRDPRLSESLAFENQ